jgi:hypothetical protein
MISSTLVLARTASLEVMETTFSMGRTAMMLSAGVPAWTPFSQAAA